MKSCGRGHPLSSFLGKLHTCFLWDILGTLVICWISCKPSASLPSSPVSHLNETLSTFWFLEVWPRQKSSPGLKQSFFVSRSDAAKKLFPIYRACVRELQIPTIPKFGEQQDGRMRLIQSAQNENRNSDFCFSQITKSLFSLAPTGGCDGPRQDQRVTTRYC